MFCRNHIRSRGAAKLFVPLYLMLVVCLALVPAARGLGRSAPASPFERLLGLHGYFDNMPLLLPLPAVGREVRAVGGSAAVGQNTTVAVELVSQGDENALGFSVTFDPTKLTYVASVKGADAGPATMNVNASQAAAGRVGVALALNAGESFATGTRQLVVLTFTPLAAASGVTAAVGFGDAPVAREVADANANVLATTFTPGGVTVLNPAPGITSVSPSSAIAGAAAFTLTVNGTGFIPSSVVRWNGSARTTSFVSATQLTAQVAASDVSAAGTVNVTIFNPAPGGGESAASTFTINNPLPVASSLSTSVVVAGGAGFNLTVGGSNFVPTSVVRWNGTDRATTYVSSTQLTAAVNAADIASAGTFNITVFNPEPGGGTSAALVFTVNAPA